MAANLKGLTTELAKALVDAPDEVDCYATEDGDYVRLELEVAEDDLGRVIGRGGRTARALRTVLNAAAAKDDLRCGLDILE